MNNTNNSNLNHLQWKVIDQCKRKGYSVEQTFEHLKAQRELCQKMIQYSDEVFNRKTFKKSVMTVTSYGATQQTSRNDVIAQLKSFDEGFIYSLTPSEITMLTNMVFWSMEEGVPSAMKFLSYFRKLIAFSLKHKDSIMFRNPINNFPVVLRVYNEESVTISYKVRGRSLTSRVNKKINSTNTRKTTSSSVPSIIHSADAGLLHLIINNVLDLNVAFIHDSVGTHPNNVAVLKEAVVKSLYDVSTVQYFESLRDQLLADIPEHLIPDELKEVPYEGTWIDWEEDLAQAYNAFM